MDLQIAAGGVDTLLLAARERAGLTQQQLAGLSTVSTRAIRDIEQGRVRHPRKSTLRLLAEAMRLGDARRAELERAADRRWAKTTLATALDTLGTLPQPVLPMFGRQPELRALTGLLRAERERFLAVVGLPGVGKTRLVQEALQAVQAEDGNRVIWVTLGESGGTVGGGDGIRSRLTDQIRDQLAGGGRTGELVSIIGAQSTVLVLDGHDGGHAADLVHLLHSCGRLKIVLTVRAPHVGFPGRLFPLLPLPVPDLAADDPLSPGVELLLPHATTLRPGTSPTSSIAATLGRTCEALDGIPRALEAAASWLLLYSPEELLEVATTAPLTLIDDTVTAPDGAQLYAPLTSLLDAAVRTLPPAPRALLDVAATLDRPWTIRAIARSAGKRPENIARDVNALLLRGLIRPLSTASGPQSAGQFRVLHLVQHLIGTPLGLAQDRPAALGRRDRPHQRLPVGL